MKRITWWPQAWLGLVFSWGALVGWPAVTGSLDWPPLLLWFGSIAWVIGYDTLYAIQDIEDDALVGVKSSARRLGDKAPLGVAHFLRARARAVGRGDLARAAGLAGARSRSFPAALHLANQALRADPEGRRAARCGCSARTGRCGLLVFLAMLVVGLSSALGARAMLIPPKHARKIAESLVERGIAAGADAADALYVGDRSSERAGAPRRARGASAAPKARRSACGCSSASARRPSPRPICRTKRCATLVERCLAMAREAPEDPYAGLAPAELLAARRAADHRRATIARTRSRRTARTRARSRGRARWPFAGVTNSSGARRERIGDRPSRSRRRAASPAPIGSTGHGCSAAVIAGEGATMQRDYAWHSARHLDDLEDADEIGRRAGERAVARLNPARPKPGRYPVLFDPRVVVDACSAISSARSAARRSRARPASCRTSSAQQVFAPGVTIVDDPAAPARPALAAVRRRGRARSRARELVDDGVLNSWIAESASARQLGIEPTGHAVARRRRRAGRRPEQPLHGGRRRAAARNCLPRFPKRCWSPS